QPKRERRGLIDRQWTARQPRIQRFTLEELEHEIIDCLSRRGRLAADVEERADIGMAERRNRPALALETGADLRIAGQVRREHLDGDRATEPRVRGAIDLAHAGSTDGRDNFIRAKP